VWKTCADALEKGHLYKVINVYEKEISTGTIVIFHLEDRSSKVEHFIYAPKCLKKHVMKEGAISARHVKCFKKMRGVRYEGFKKLPEYIEYTFKFVK
jgi:hypothetical protein